jgi:hypothetical protein
MGHSSDSFRYVVFATSLMLVFVFWRREIMEAIQAFRNNFPRGGPRSPSHPLPADDALLLRRKRRKQG